VNTSKILLPTALAAACVANNASADTDDAAYATTGNIALVSDDLFRGLTQTWGRPAIQGGGDLTLKNGFAAGFWGSSVSDRTYPGAALELDLYASYGRAIGADASWRVGLYSYRYPNGNLDDVGLRSRSFDTTEANAALTWRWLTLKYSTSLTDYFGIDTEQGYRADSKGTRYVELDAAIPLNDAWSLALHAGRTDVATRLATPLANGADDPDYDDVGATLKWQFAPRWSASAGATYADNRAFYAHTASFRNPADTTNVGGARGFLMLQGTF
jgi:uncharacterized protein (TIGR02001 family)